MVRKSTLNALINRGITHKLAQKIVEEGHTLTSLRSLDSDQLKNLDLTDENIQNIQTQSRTPIKSAIESELLYESAYSCAVCSKTTDVVIHHIVPWEESRDHSEDNLIVLCHNCHAKAHSHSTMSKNLTISKLRLFKKKWIAEVKKRRTRSVINQMNNKGCSRWDYFNHLRLIDYARSYRVNLTRLESFKDLRKLKMVNASGILNLPSEWKGGEPTGYLYSTGNNHYLYSYMKDMLEKLVQRIHPKNITEQWIAGRRINAKPGSFVFLESAVDFKHPRNYFKMEKYTIQGTTHKKPNRCVFSIDSWDATSNSALSLGLCNRSKSLLVALIRSDQRQNSGTEYKLSILAIGSGFEPSYDAMDGFYKRGGYFLKHSDDESE